MSDVEEWRRRRAEELYNGAPIARSSLEAQAALVAAGGGSVSRPEQAPAAIASSLSPRPPLPAFQPMPALSPRLDTRGHAAATTGRSGSPVTATSVAIVGLLLAGATGWMARGVTSSAQFASISTQSAAPSSPPSAAMRPAAIAAPVAHDAPRWAAKSDRALASGVAERATARETAAVTRTAARAVRPAPPVRSLAGETNVAASGPSPAAPGVERRARGNAPSFSCHRDHGTVTSMICTDPDLARLDRDLTTRFAALDRSAPQGEVERLHEGETAFLNARQNCRTPDCIADVYARRLDEIGASR